MDADLYKNKTILYVVFTVLFANFNVDYTCVFYRNKIIICLLSKSRFGSYSHLYNPPPIPESTRECFALLNLKSSFEMISQTSLFSFV